MNVLDHKSDKELTQSLIGEIAKAKNEIACAEADIKKAKKQAKQQKKAEKKAKKKSKKKAKSAEAAAQ